MGGPINCTKAKLICAMVLSESLTSDIDEAIKTSDRRKAEKAAKKALFPMRKSVDWRIYAKLF
jgi:hypothetical protein